MTDPNALHFDAHNLRDTFQSFNSQIALKQSQFMDATLMKLLSTMWYTKPGEDTLIEAKKHELVIAHQSSTDGTRSHVSVDGVNVGYFCQEFTSDPPTINFKFLPPDS